MRYWSETAVVLFLLARVGCAEAGLSQTLDKWFETVVTTFHISYPIF
jgi:hypothetical protein